MGLLKGALLPVYLFGLFAVFGFFFGLLAVQLKPIYRTWLKLVHFIGKIIASVILILTYYAVLTPSAILMRLLSGAPLPTKPDKKTPSYWVARNEPTQPRDRFLKRY
jgi:hypothetical protein